MDYALNTVNVVAQSTVPIARGLYAATTYAEDVAHPLQRLVPDTWLPPGVPFDVGLATVSGLSIFTAGYLILGRV